MSIKQEAQRELIWRRCRKDPLFAFESFFMIQHPEGRRLFQLREPQKVALANWLGGGNWLTLKARQIGWSTLVAAFVLWSAIWHEDKRILIISKGEREAQEVLAKVKFMWERLPPWIRAKAPKLINDTLQNMKWANGSEISSLPSASDPGRGFSGSLVVVDEWAFLPNPEGAWASIEPIADIGGQILGLSTANGSGNFFEDQWNKAVEGINSFKTMFYGWWAVEERDQAWFEQKCLDMLPWQRAQEYPDSPEEAFIKSGNPVFGDLIDALVAVPPKWVGRLSGKLWFDEPNGQLSIWERPIPGRAYVCAADVAEGLLHGDASTAHVIDVVTGNEVAHLHCRLDPDLFTDALYDLGMYYNECLLGPEANNHGLTVVTLLRKKGYPSLFRRRALNKTGSNTPLTQYGWQTSKVSKPLMIDELAYSLRLQEVHVRSARTIKELRTYQRLEDGKMAGSPFDDCVISLAITNQMRKFAYQPEYYGKTEAMWGTMDWWTEELNKDIGKAKKEAAFTIGGRSNQQRRR